jgi:hypothetical protein
VVDVLPQLSVMLPGLFDEPMRQGCECDIERLVGEVRGGAIDG